MDIKKRYIKMMDYHEIVATDGRLIRVFTMSEHPVWMTCIYDEVRDIAWRLPHLNYEEAYNDYVTFCKLLEVGEVAKQETVEKEPPEAGGIWKNPWFILCVIVFVAWIFMGWNGSR